MSVIVSFLAKNFIPPTVLCVLERLYLPKFLPSLTALSPLLPVPKLYGSVILINVIGSAFFTVFLGVKVGGARKAAIEKAKKEGDPDAEARFSYPKMYAEGFSAEAKQFNCVQRAHQHTLETYTSMIAMSLIGGLTQPVVTALAGLLWIVARAKWSAGYSTGEPGNRYDRSGGWGRHIWTALLWLIITCASTSVQLLVF
uniref:Glutathione transferase n=2 Tax=Chrysotila carterae TaxID=13221 RepID=A0A7S4EU90_CHRCT